MPREKWREDRRQGSPPRSGQAAVRPMPSQRAAPAGTLAAPIRGPGGCPEYRESQRSLCEKLNCPGIVFSIGARP